MKVLLLLLAIHFIYITCYKIKSREEQYLEILENFILQDRKYILPNDELVSKINPDLIIRISTPKEKLDGIYSYHPPFYSIFNTDDSQNFLIIKFDYKVETYRINSIVLNFKKLFQNNRDSAQSSSSTSENYLETEYELIILCRKVSGDTLNDQDDTLYITIPIEEVLDPEKFRVYDYILEGMIDSMIYKIENKSKNIFDINHLFSSISNNLLYLKNLKNSDINLQNLDISPEIPEISIKNFFIFQDSLKISSEFKNKIKEFFIKEKVNFQRNELKIRKGFVDFLSDTNSDITLNSAQNPINPLNSFTNTKIILDPDQLVKNFYLRQINIIKQEIYKFDLESFKKYLIEKYHYKLNIYQKLLITEYINVFHLEKDTGLSQIEIKNEFDNMYDKYINDSKAKGKNTYKNNEDFKENNADIIENQNFIPFSNNENLNKLVLYKPFFTMKNITSIIGKTKNPYIPIIMPTEGNLYKGNNLKNSKNLKTSKVLISKSNNSTDAIDEILKKLIIENKNYNETLIKYKNIISNNKNKSIVNDKKKDNNFHNITINSGNYSQTFKKNDIKTKIDINNTKTPNNKNSVSYKDNNFNNTKISNEKIINSSSVKSTEQEDPQDIGMNLSLIPNAFNSNSTNYSNGDKNKFRESTHYSKFNPVLKNEKIKYVNGSLVVIETLMVPNKDEKIQDAKRKFRNILKYGIK